MNGNERREMILQLLQQGKKPISGSELASRLGVSRQVIVQDIALLRAEKKEIMATARGYLLYPGNELNIKRVLAIRHNREQIRDELQTIVDLGGSVIDVFVEHPIYGQISANLIVESRKDVQEFLDNMEENKTLPLMHLTNGIHYHTIEAKSEEILDEIEKMLDKKGYLIRE